MKQENNLDEKTVSTIAGIEDNTKNQKISRKEMLDQIKIISNTKKEVDVPDFKNPIVTELPPLNNNQEQPVDRDKNESVKDVKKTSLTEKFIEALLVLAIVLLLVFIGFRLYVILNRNNEVNNNQQNISTEQQIEYDSNIQGFINQISTNRYEVIQNGSFSYPTDLQIEDSKITIGNGEFDFYMSLNPNRIYMEEGNIKSLIYSKNQIIFESTDSFVVLNNETKQYIRITRSDAGFEEIENRVDSITGGIDSLRNEIPLSYLIFKIIGKTLPVQKASSGEWHSTYVAGDTNKYSTEMTFRLSVENNLENIALYSKEFDEMENINYQFNQLEENEFGVLLSIPDDYEQLFF